VPGVNDENAGSSGGEPQCADPTVYGQLTIIRRRSGTPEVLQTTGKLLVRRRLKIAIRRKTSLKLQGFSGV
jgi:hypothetical protein